MVNNEKQSQTTGTPSLEEVLCDMNETGGFEVSVLTSIEGLPIATAPPDFDSDTTAAMVALLQRVSRDAQNEVGMEEVDEVTIRDQGRRRLVCRYLNVRGQKLIIASIVPPDHYYRRVTNRAIKQIEQLLA